MCASDILQLIVLVPTQVFGTCHQVKVLNLLCCVYYMLIEYVNFFSLTSGPQTIFEFLYF